MIANPAKIFLVIAASILTGAIATPVLPSAAAPDRTIAVVNNTAVYRQDLDREKKIYALRLYAQGFPISDEKLKRYEGNFRETLINRVLLLQQSKMEGITVRDSQVTRALNIFKTKFKDDAEYQDALAKVGVTEELLTDQLRQGLEIKALTNKKIAHDASVSDKQVRAFYDDHPEEYRQPERVRASHILIQVPPDADEAKKAEALSAIQSLKVRIDSGESFANLAMEYSDCPSKVKGGDLGFFSREQVAQSFADAAFALQTGQVSDVVTTQDGYHLIHVTERQDVRMSLFNDVKEDISNRLRWEQEDKKIGDYIEKLKEKADIQRFPL